MGGSDNGECAFIRISNQDGRIPEHDVPSSYASEVDSALPIDLEPPTRVPSPWPSREASESARHDTRRPLPEVHLHKFGDSIVNSVTVHRFPGDGKDLADEDVMILRYAVLKCADSTCCADCSSPSSNNDKTVTVYSLTRGKALKVLYHQTCMNYAIVSPDSKLLTAVGDEPHAYFYDVTRDTDAVVHTENGEKLTGWEWTLLRHVDMDISTQFDDGCCFTVAFSPSSHLCAIGSQSGVISIFDVRLVRESLNGLHDKSSVICHFHSSRSFFDGGAVRSMTFSPVPWDLLVWIEDNGRAGIADVRQAFTRRQILHLDANEPSLQEVRTEPISEDSEGLGFAFGSRGLPESRHDMDAAQRAMLDSLEGSSNEQSGDGTERSSMRESLMQDLTERERLIVEFLNSARWTSRMEEGLTDRRGRLNLQPPSAARSRPAGTTDGGIRTSRPTSPLRHSDTLHDVLRDNHMGQGADRHHSSSRRQASVVLSQGNQNANETETTNVDTQPSITVSWTASPAELQPATLDTSRTADPITTDSSNFLSDFHDAGADPLSRQRSQRSTSTPRRPERQESTSETRYEPPRLLNSELRANVAAERLRRQRQLINEAQNRNSLRDHRYRHQVLGVDQSRSPRWIRSILNDLPDGNMHSYRDQDPSGTAGLGWGDDGRTL